MIGDGQTFYNGAPQDIKRHLWDAYCIKMPKFVNPTEFLIKISMFPEKFKKNLTLKVMHVVCR